MDKTSNLNNVLGDKCDERLRRHIDGIDVLPISRISPARILEIALPNVALIELVSGDTFANKYDPLYQQMFHGGERERSDLIIERLYQDFAGARRGLAPYRVLGLRDSAGDAIAAAQFSVLFLSPTSPSFASNSPSPLAVPYLQYIYVRPANRRQDLSELLHTLVLAVAQADARDANASTDTPAAAAAAIVPFTLFETEPPCHGADEGARAHAARRVAIHARGGSRAMMLVADGDVDHQQDGDRGGSVGDQGKGTTETTRPPIVSAHVQPGLEPEDGPLTLVWAIRANPACALAGWKDGVFDVDEGTTGSREGTRMEGQLGRAVVAGYYRSLRDEGFPEANIALAERMTAARCVGRRFVLMPLGDVTREMYVGIDR